MPEVVTREWKKQRRKRRVGDQLGQRVHDLLWRAIKASDEKASERRLADLRAMFRGLLPDAATKLADRLETGDLAPDFAYRLAESTQKRLLEELRLGSLVTSIAIGGMPVVGTLLNRGTGRPGTSNPGTSNPGTSGSGTSGSGTAAHGGAASSTGPLSNAEKSVLKMAAGVPWKIGSRRVFSRRVGNAAVFGTVSGAVVFTALNETRATYEAYVGLSKKGVEEVEVAVTDAVFGASAGITVGKNTAGRPVYGFKLGTNVFDLELSLDPMSPVSMEVPLAAVQIADVEKELRGLKLAGRAVLNVVLTIDVVPDYAKLVTWAKAGGKAMGKVIRRSARSFGQSAVKLRGLAAKVIRGGRRAWSWMIEKLLEQVGKKIARQLAKDFELLGSKATQLGAATRVLTRYAGRALGVAALWLEIQGKVDQLVAKTLRATVEKQREEMLEWFRIGYGSMLSDLTTDWWKSYFDGVKQSGMLTEVWSARPPRSVEHWLEKGVDYTDLDEWLRNHSTSRQKVRVPIAEDDWYQRLVEAEVAAVFALRPGKSPDGAETRQRAYEEARLAGSTACYQDVMQFLIAHMDDASHGEGLTPEVQWTAVGQLHRFAFAEDDFSRQLAYYEHISFGAIDIIPFAE